MRTYTCMCTKEHKPGIFKLNSYLNLLYMVGDMVIANQYTEIQKILLHSQVDEREAPQCFFVY